MLVNRQSFSDYKIQYIPGQNSVLPIAVVPGAIPDPRIYIHTYYNTLIHVHTYVHMYVRILQYIQILLFVSVYVHSVCECSRLLLCWCISPQRTASFCDLFLITL